MKAKLGFAIGVNVAVACLLMQGCKAPRVTDNKYGSDVKTIEAQPIAQPVVVPTDDIKVADAPKAPKAPAAAPAPVAVETAPVTVETAPVVVETAPVVAPVAAPAGADDFTIYTIKPGDMLSKISRRYNIRQKAILDLNPGLAPNKLYAGKKIKLPGKVDAAAPAAAVVSVEAASVTAPKTVKAAKFTGETKEYVVQRGDSLSIIAYRNGTNVRTLKEINGVSTDRVFIGQKLKVPAAKAAKPAVKAEAKKAAEVKAPVAKDVKAPVAKTAKAPVAKTAKAPVAKTAKAPAAKETAATKVDVKEAAKAPVVEEAQKAAAAPAVEAAKPVAAAAAPAVEAATPADVEAPAPAPAASEIHTVKEGEDVVSIAISYGVSPSALMDANDLKSSEVKPGDKLKIPAKIAQ